MLQVLQEKCNRCSTIKDTKHFNRRVSEKNDLNIWFSPCQIDHKKAGTL